MALTPTVMTPVKVVDYGKLLNEAREAQHALMMGQSAKVFVDQNGERVEYTAANQNRLAAYIAFLEQKLGIAAVSGPMRAWM